MALTRYSTTPTNIAVAWGLCTSSGTKAFRYRKTRPFLLFVETLSETRLRAGLVECARRWRWGSLWRWVQKPNKRFNCRGRCPAFPIGSSVSTSLFQRRKWQRSDCRPSKSGHWVMQAGLRRSPVVSNSNPQFDPRVENGFDSGKLTLKSPAPKYFIHTALRKGG